MPCVLLLGVEESYVAGCTVAATLLGAAFCRVGVADVRQPVLQCVGYVSLMCRFAGRASAETHACFGRHTCVFRPECMCASADAHVYFGRCTISDVPVCKVESGFLQLLKPRFLRAGIAVKKLQKSAARLLPLQDEMRNFAGHIVKRLTTIKHPQYK